MDSRGDHRRPGHARRLGVGDERGSASLIDIVRWQGSGIETRAKPRRQNRFIAKVSSWPRWSAAQWKGARTELLGIAGAAAWRSE